MAESSIQKLCDVMRKRSREHKIATSRMSDLPGMMASILRMELDSMIRVIFLLSKDDLLERERLSYQTLSGEKWTVLTLKNKNSQVLDKDMVELANELQGWTRSVYKFGCAFIHLSNFHDYSENNPFDSLSENDKTDILSHMRHYHGGPTNDNPTFIELAKYFPCVFEKISGNLKCYIDSLERNEISTDAI